MTLEEEVRRGAYAKEIIDNPVYQEVFKNLKDGVIVNITKAPIKDDDLIIRLKITLELLDQIEKGFNRVFKDGKSAEIKLKDETFKKRSIVI